MSITNLSWDLLPRDLFEPPTCAIRLCQAFISFSHDFSVIWGCRKWGKRTYNFLIHIPVLIWIRTGLTAEFLLSGVERLVEIVLLVVHIFRGGKFA